MYSCYSTQNTPQFARILRNVYPHYKERHTMGDFMEETRRTKSLERAETVIEILKKNPAGDPITVQQIAEEAGAYYEEILHVVTALEAIGIVRRYRRNGAPREGARVAYSLETPTAIRNARRRLGLDSRARTRRGDRRVKAA